MRKDVLTLILTGCGIGAASVVSTIGGHILMKGVTGVVNEKKKASSKAGKK